MRQVYGLSKAGYLDTTPNDSNKNLIKISKHKNRENSEDPHMKNVKGFNRSLEHFSVRNKRRSDSLASNIVDKLYMPFVKNMGHQFKLKENLAVIKKDTKNSVIHNFFLTKKKVELGKLRNDFIIYNNPSNKFNKI
jgi:hypothetical protein